MMAGFVAGIFDSMISFSILLQSGHVQIRSENFEMEKPSLKWEDLMDHNEELLDKALGLTECNSRCTGPVGKWVCEHFR